ncbi:TRAP transporter large permease [Propylenella binzhouense]|uniref:TRAP transporter large permease protein n=1 Tax=Propylenella binzhouense TaxID=2555902 RepID=A0A964WS06_9HYPH|nr:TRAP transporter large permease [Propylenella binzhouense]MYZ46356.1 TRAP transporter large permease [Propylenella binzhouense]
MSSVEVGFWSLGAVVILIALRVPIGVALGGVGLLGIAYIRDFRIAYAVLGSTPFEFAAHHTLSAIPMFLLMGAIAHGSGISQSLFRAARLWLGGIPGGLAVATNYACAGFAAASGSSIATAAAMAKIAVPEMLKAGYDRGLATGVVASAGTLGSMIPPSIMFVLFGVFAEVSIVKLLIAGIIPGLLTAFIYMVMIMVRSTLNPALAPRLDPEEQRRLRPERIRALLEIWPLLALMLGIIGGLYSGVVTPTEAGAAGAALALLIALLQRRLSVARFVSSLIEATASTARIFFVAAAAALFAKFLAMTGMPFYFGSLLSELGSPLLLIVATSVIFTILGMFLDPIGLMLLTLPILLPMFEAQGVDLIWFGVLTVKFLEIGLLTPPVGFNVYVIKATVGDAVPLAEIFRGVAWFLLCEFIVVVLLVLFPQIALFLPNTM